MPKLRKKESHPAATWAHTGSKIYCQVRHCQNNRHAQQRAEVKGTFYMVRDGNACVDFWIDTSKDDLHIAVPCFSKIFLLYFIFIKKASEWLEKKMKSPTVRFWVSWQGPMRFHCVIAVSWKKNRMFLFCRQMRYDWRVDKTSQQWRLDWPTMVPFATNWE